MTRASASEGRVVVFGEVLFDRFPDGSEVLGGAPFNVAWNLRGLGADPLLVSRVGSDRLGDRIRAAMGEWGLETAGLQIDPRHPTGTVDVRMAGGEPSFHIVSERAYDFIEWDDVPEVSDAALLYHGSLALRRRTSRSTLERLVHRRETPVFLDVNLRPPWWERTTVWRLLERADEIKLNEDELCELMPDASDFDQRVQAFRSRVAPARLYVTRGSGGALAFAGDVEPCEVRPEAAARVIDTVGAGDAFSSVLILGRLRGWSLAATLERAQQLATAVIGTRGATVREPAFYDRFVNEWDLG